MTDYTFFSALTHCIRQGGAPVLCTIVDSAGSAPRGAGARMALLSDGTWIGTVSGGAVENLVQQRASAVMDGTAQGGLEHYSLGGEASRTGMVCGGAVTVCIQTLGEKQLADLERRGFSREQIETIHLPIDLDIGGETPAEIAVSVTAQLIQVRAGRLGRCGGGLCPA